MDEAGEPEIGGHFVGDTLRRRLPRRHLRLGRAQVSLTLTGYQDVAGGFSDGSGFNKGTAGAPVPQLVTLADIPANTVYQVAWNGRVDTSPLNLFASDYDDQLGNLVPYTANAPRNSAGKFDSAGGQCNQPGAGASRESALSLAIST
jgi:hypothetical protein